MLVCVCVCVIALVFFIMSCVLLRITMIYTMLYGECRIFTYLELTFSFCFLNITAQVFR